MTTISCTEFSKIMGNKSAEFEQLRKAYYADVTAALTATLAQVPGWTLIRVMGYTPGFNDGDPCTHSTCIEVDGDCEELPDGFDSSVFDNTYVGLSSADERALTDGVMIVSDVFEMQYDTNFQIWFVRSADGTVITTHSEYDCGW